MARPLRIEFAGALYHVTSRGDKKNAIYLDDDDRAQYLNILEEICSRFNWVPTIYGCLCLLLPIPSNMQSQLRALREERNLQYKIDLS